MGAIAKNRKWIGGAAFILILFGALIVKARREMPSFEGRSLNNWLERLPVTIGELDGEYFTKHVHYSDERSRRAGTNAKSPQSAAEKAAEQEAYIAIKALGKKCLPVLLARLKEVDSQGTLRLRSWAAKAHLPPALIGDSAGIRRGQAVTALLKLDYAAHSLTPDLILLTNNSNLEVRRAASMVLKKVAPEPMPEPEKDF